jgi:hypothetical protein
MLKSINGNVNFDSINGVTFDGTNNLVLKDVTFGGGPMSFEIYFKFTQFTSTNKHQLFNFKSISEDKNIEIYKQDNTLREIVKVFYFI